ncbi:hypothetical protein ABHL48_004726 [Escherichia coli]|nr:hypothetical protein [Escherichia coli]HCN0947864.1 hypothetical protein [Escherichia coli]
MKPTLLQTVENILQTLSMLFQLTGRLIDVKALVSGSAVAKNVQRTPTSSVSSSVYSASVSRTTADITLLANNPIFAPDQVSFFGFSLPVSGFHVIILDTLFH